MLADTSNLAGSNLAGSGDVIDGGSNLWDRKTLFAPNRYDSSANVKPERTIKAVVSSTLVRLHLVSLNDVGNVICGGKIGSGQHL